MGLPELRGRTPIHKGSSGGANHNLGQKSGEETHILTVSEMPSHNHQVTGGTGQDTDDPCHDPDGAFPGQTEDNTYSTATNPTLVRKRNSLAHGCSEPRQETASCQVTPDTPTNPNGCSQDRRSPMDNARGGRPTDAHKVLSSRRRGHMENEASKRNKGLAVRLSVGAGGLRCTLHGLTTALTIGAPAMIEVIFRGSLTNEAHRGQLRAWQRNLRPDGLVETDVAPMAERATQAILCRRFRRGAGIER